MTLGFRLTIQLLVLLGCLILTSGVALWSIRGTRQDFSIALANYDKLQKVYTVGLLLQSSKVNMRDVTTLEEAINENRRAKEIFSELVQVLPVTGQRRQELLNLINKTGIGKPAEVNEALKRLSSVIPDLYNQIELAQQQADERKTATFWWMGVVAGISLLASALVGLFQWQAVMGPLREITKGVKRIGGTKFDAPIHLRKADREFQDLSRDFNQMAGQLESAYGQLQNRVEGATRSLVQSERLAGVGMLAAGVAHEINNPLAIITGRIELLLTNKSIDEHTRGSLKIALDEAFRCKQIIDRLLTLSRGPSGKRETARLDQLVASVVHNVRALPGASGRKIELIESDNTTGLIDEGEIKQVILNLLINAIQATSEDGKIEVSVK